MADVRGTAGVDSDCIELVDALVFWYVFVPHVGVQVESLREADELPYFPETVREAFKLEGQDIRERQNRETLGGFIQALAVIASVFISALELVLFEKVAQAFK